MKHFRLFVIISIMVFCTIPCYAEYPYEEYYKVNNETYITTVPNAELYKLSSEEYSRMKDKSSNSQWSRDYIYLYGDKTKKIKNPTQLKVVRFTNTVKQQGFNAYIVVYKDNLYVISSDYVQDNTYLNKRNTEIIEAKQNLIVERQKLEAKKQVLEEEKDKINEEINRLIEKRRREYTDSLHYYTALKGRLPKIIDSLVDVKTAQAQALADKEYKDWYNSLPASSQKAAKLISITDLGLSEPNSVGGCDYTFWYINKSKKTIKYLHWTGTVYNRVNDPAYCEIRRTATRKGVDTGPYAPGEEGGGTWETIVYNYAADTLKLNSISITYMDGSSAAIAAADIRRLVQEPSTEVYVSRFEIELSMLSDYECRKRINDWERKIENLEKDRSALMSSNERYRNLESLISVEESKIIKLVNQINKIDSFISFRSQFYVQCVSRTSSDNAYSGSSTNTNNKENPFVTFGIEGSVEGLKSFSTGWGLSMRIGRFNSLFNATLGFKYQYTGYKKWVNYSYDDYYSSWGYNYVYSYADYKRKVNQFVIPVFLNWNVVRKDNYAFYLGGGFEFGILLSDNQKFVYDFGDPFNESDFYKYGNDELLQLSVPSRDVVLQTGFAGRHWDCKIYYKFKTNNKIYTNGEKGAVGTAFTFYF